MFEGSQELNPQEIIVRLIEDDHQSSKFSFPLNFLKEIIHFCIIYIGLN